MKIIAKIDFVANNEQYIKGDEIKGLTYEQIQTMRSDALMHRQKAGEKRLLFFLSRYMIPMENSSMLLMN